MIRTGLRLQQTTSESVLGHIGFRPELIHERLFCLETKNCLRTPEVLSRQTPKPEHEPKFSDQQ